MKALQKAIEKEVCAVIKKDGVLQMVTQAVVFVNGYTELFKGSNSECINFIQKYNKRKN